MAKIRLEVVGKREIAGVSRGGIVELDDEQYNIRALERAGHVIREDKSYSLAETDNGRKLKKNEQKPSGKSDGGEE